MAEILLELQHIKKDFSGASVLRDISLSVHRGEIVSIIGPSGSGKSTLLRCATLLEKVESGSLYYKGIPVCEEGKYVPKKERKKFYGFFGLVFQNFNLFPHYSVLKNVMDAPISVQKKPKKEAEQKARELLQQLGLQEKAMAYPCQLSGGQQQRVSIARALALNPQILFFDEPTSALDPELTIEVLKVIRQLAKEHMTMIIVTHEMSFAKEVSDQIVFMEDGIIQEKGTPEEIFHSDKQRVREFIGKLSD